MADYPCPDCDGSGIRSGIGQGYCGTCEATGRVETKPDHFYVIENTPGYLPDDDEPFETDSYVDAVAYANQLADELEEQGYETDRSWASQDNLYAIHATTAEKMHDLGRNIEIVRSDEE